MAQLKDLVVTGASRLIGDVAANKILTTTIVAPTSAGGASYGPGSNGLILVSNGSSVYWNNGVLSAGSAGYAASAALATHAASANYSMSAALATHSASSQYAINAASALYARNAASAGYSASAAQATHAASAQYAISSASAGYSASAALATHAASALYAISSASAGYAASAALATHASSAQYAINAVSAQYARNAASAQYARNAASAGYATSAANATYAASAGSSTEAIHAVTAEYAASAGYALTAGTSVSSGSAGYAASAALATHSASANYALSASSAGYAASAALATHAASANYSMSAALATHAASADYAIQAGSIKKKIFYGTCNTASATTAKAVTCPEFAAADLVKGATIFTTFDYTNSGAVASLTLNVNGTGAKNIKHLYNNGLSNLPAVAYLATNLTYMFWYDGTYWTTLLDYDTNDVNRATLTYPRVNTGSVGIGRYTLFMEANDGTFLSLTSTFNSTSANHAKNTAKFKLDRVYYANRSTDIAANNSADTANSWMDSQTSLVDVRYSANCIGNLTARAPFFIVGTVGADGYFTLADTWYSTTWPSSDDGKVYIYIGHIYNDGTPYRVAFEEKNPAYIYKNGGIQLYSGYALNAGGAISAGSAGYAASAAQATHAASAGYAISAALATHAASANYSMSAALATHAASAQYAIAAASAGYATSAALATHAASANYSTSAALATHAASANYSMSAGRATYAAQAAITTTAGAVTYYSDTAGTFANDADFLWDATNNKLTAAKLNGYVMAGLISGSTLGTAATVEGLNNVACTTASHAEGESTTASGYASHAEGYKSKATSYYTHAEGSQCTASATAGHAEGWASEASGFAAHGEGKSGHASGAYSHAEGMETWATGTASHAEGASGAASGYSSHAEGPTLAKGNYSHSEGYGFMISGLHQAVATGEGSHIEGALCLAHGFAAHAEGYYTIAQSKSLHVFGEFNTIDPIGTTATRGQYVEIVGNGTASNARSNIRTLDWNGNQWLAGGISAAKFIGTTTAAYGNILPEDGVEGQIFFQVSSGDIYEIPVGGTTGQALVKSSSADRAVTWGDVGGKQVPDTVKFYPSGSTSTTANTDDAVFNTNVYVLSNVLYGACWNDYAEFRQLREDIPIPYGYCVCENGDDTLSLSTERMLPAPAIVSDTFGYAIGVTDKAQVPIAVSGRVLVYPYENRDNYKPGDCVCAGPEGKVCIMTREEIKEYPDRIVGIVSAIPQYTIWGQNDIAVDNRIWVKVK